MAKGDYDYASKLIPDNKFIASYENLRVHFIMKLGVPTYQKMRKVMFHDVLMKLTQRIVRLHYESSDKKKMRQILASHMQSS